MPEYNSFTEARKNLKDVLDAADQGGVATIHRPHADAAVVDAQQLRRTLATLIPPGAHLVADGANEWAMFLTDYPIAGSGLTPEEATSDLIEALREYSDDWLNRLRHAPNHRANWGLVQLIALSSDADLESWLSGTQS